MNLKCEGIEHKGKDEVITLEDLNMNVKKLRSQQITIKNMCLSEKVTYEVITELEEKINKIKIVMHMIIDNE